MILVGSSRLGLYASTLSRGREQASYHEDVSKHTLSLRTWASTLSLGREQAHVVTRTWASTRYITRTWASTLSRGREQARWSEHVSYNQASLPRCKWFIFISNSKLYACQLCTSLFWLRTFIPMAFQPVCTCVAYIRTLFAIIVHKAQTCWYKQTHTQMYVSNHTHTCTHLRRQAWGRSCTPAFPRAGKRACTPSTAPPTAHARGHCRNWKQRAN